MTGKTVTRADLCEAVYQKVGLSRTESSALVELVLKEITDCLERGETVKLSSFGSFVVRKKGQRVGRNPKTGTEVPISPHRAMWGKRSATAKAATGNSGPPDAKERRRDRGNGGHGPRPRKRGGSWKRRPKRFAPSARSRTNSTCPSTCRDSGKPGFPRSPR